jgi:hypothetical protein
VSRSRIDNFDRRFSELNDSRIQVARLTGNDLIYKTEEEHENDLWPISIGTHLIRSAAAVEQTFNGITTRLWDDPFEWTLPERLSTVSDLLAYFEEVEETRKRGFEFFKSDEDLQRSIPAPIELRTLDQILDNTRVRSKKYLLQAESMVAEATK